MGKLAATLVATLLPALPYRQWVFTYPHALRRSLAREPKLLTAVLGRSLRTLAAYQRRRARVLGLDGVETAALCALQRFGSAINLNVHAHVIAPDAVFVVDGEALRPRVLPPPTDAELAQVALTPPLTGVDPSRQVASLAPVRAHGATRLLHALLARSLPDGRLNSGEPLNEPGCSSRPRTRAAHGCRWGAAGEDHPAGAPSPLEPGLAIAGNETAQACQRFDARPFVAAGHVQSPCLTT